MQTDHWLLLTDYASKYRISVSTLRRRIKSGQINFRLDGGKYFIYDGPPLPGESAPHFRETLMFPGLKPVAVEAAPYTQAAEAELNNLRQVPAVIGDSSAQPDEPVVATATRLLNELKRAYMNILHEKEEQIIHLKAEVTDLKTLVRVLEEDNDRMRRMLAIPRTN